MVKGSLKESKEVVDESMWADWQNVKCKGLKYAQDFIQSYWAIENGFGFVHVSQDILNKILKGDLKTFEEITTFQQLEIKNLEFTEYYNVYYYTLFDKNIEQEITIIDSVFIN
ncbi:hypothetical protein IUY40_09360 [Flavobacterium sp. ALJ2]|uniref:hypothetical protein n=1 Tax=Flavobacterium sp. ALJ2 TaxID=2786960 RepID=UPI00189DF195|nr:hypothetical protein [Flavobacterium sp. ALJ2]MBF7091749.1 hypothetical protein [Flavobacterium sp. ALJ2]